jgi:MFS family permease
MDSTIYTLVLQPALQDLLGGQIHGRVQPELISWYGGLILSVFLLGWAVGGVCFGVLADRFGRTRILMWTIVIYAVFTGLAALSQTWWELAIFRFITALGIGGEWAAGASLVAEVWPESKRAKAAGWLQSAWAVGFFLAALVHLALRHSGWRPIFVVGIGPALVAIVVRLWVREPERWVKAARQAPAFVEGSTTKLGQLFSPANKRATLVGAGLAFVAVFGLWGATNWTPTLVRSLPEFQHMDGAKVNSYVSYATMLLNTGSLVGYLSFGPLADRVGRRPVFALMCLGSVVMLPIAFLVPRSYAAVLLLLPSLGFFNNGIFSGFAIYLPELYPTAIRATGAGFCFNAGRALASAGPFLTGYLVQQLGTFGRAASAVALIYLVGLVILVFAPETKGRPLPD